MAEIGKLSISKITTYMGCSLAHYLKYVVHEKVPTNVRYAFGKAIHYMLEGFYKKNYKSPDSFAGYWNHYWGMLASGDNLKGKQKLELKLTEYPLKNGNFLKIGNHIEYGEDPVGIFFGYMKLGQSILKKFYVRHIPEKNPIILDRNPPIALEQGFGVKKTEPFEIDGIKMTGYIDRIDKNKNKEFFISDYKTDKKCPEDNSFILHRHPQFTLYSYVFRKKYNAKEKAILYYHLRTGNVFKTHRNEKDYDYLRALINVVAEGITNDKFTPFYGFHCSFCDYQVACEKYTLDNHGGPKISSDKKIIKAKRYYGWDDDIPEKLSGFLEEEI